VVRQSKHMHIAEVVTIAKSLPLLRLNTYKSLILSYSADYRRILGKNMLQNIPFLRDICMLFALKKTIFP
uniref:hypothetical protein n=1 Tax=Alistipes putredinis TaxID=28117 RepID=UPI003FD82DB4